MFVQDVTTDTRNPLLLHMTCVCVMRSGASLLFLVAVCPRSVLEMHTITHLLSCVQRRWPGVRCDDIVIDDQVKQRLLPAHRELLAAHLGMYFD